MKYIHGADCMSAEQGFLAAEAAGEEQREGQQEHGHVEVGAAQPQVAAAPVALAWP